MKLDKKIMKARAKTLIRRGYSLSKVAEELNVPVSTLCGWFKVPIRKIYNS